MNSIRSRLTVWYAVALGAAVITFGTALYLERRSTALEELDHRLRIEADFVEQFLSQSYQVVGQITEPDPWLPVEIPEAQRPRRLEGTLRSFLDGLADFLIVVGRDNHALYVTDTSAQREVTSISRLSEDPLLLHGEIVRELLASAREDPPPVDRGTIDSRLPSGTLRYLILPVADAGPEVRALLVATATSNVTFGPSQLLGSMLLILPVVLLGAIGLGFLLAGTALRPLTGIMHELQAITDGRSLHRRLAVPTTEDEFAQLARTANQMLARLETSFSSLRRFTADASHELKTPLMVLRAGVERTITNPHTPTENLEELDRALEEINRLTELVDSLLMLARADEGRAPLALKECDLRDLVVDVSETAGMLAESEEIRVSTRIPDTPVTLAVDPIRMKQLLLNLITNAIKYTPAGGTVGIRLGDEHGVVTLAVHDTGVGIAPADLPHIFDRFYRADAARSRSGDRPGAGLGLAITKWIAEAHGGAISAASRPGRGTVFSVRLPRSGVAIGDDDS